jgi:hypothetical protein
MMCPVQNYFCPRETKRRYSAIRYHEAVVMVWLVCMVAVCGSMAVTAVRDSASIGIGGITQIIPDIINNLEMEALARFAVTEYNNQKV